MTETLATKEMITVEVAFALPAQQVIKTLTVPRGTSAAAAVTQSRILERFAAYLPEAEAPAMGIFSRPLNGQEMPLPADYILEAHDRVEIYRPLLIDPKQARLARAARAKEKKKK